MPSVTKFLLSRECGGLYGLRLSGALAYSASCTSSTIINASGPEPSPPITAQFAQDPSSGKLLAIADQEGFVTILQTDRILPYSVRLDPGGQRPRAAWEAHKNLVHDLCWAKADSRLYTASGDSTVAVWDTSCATRLATGVEHQLSVKCLTAFGPGGDVFASGSRDGSILVWDVRLPGRRARMADGSSASTLACVWKAEGAHKVGGATLSRGNAGRGRTPVRSASQQQGVTSVVWLPHTSFLLASAGERCSLVKYWDLRCTASCPVDSLCTAASTGSGQLAAAGSLGLERSGSLGRASSGETPSGSSGHPGAKRTRGGTPRSQGSQPAGLQDLLFSFLGCRGTAGDGGAGGTPATGAASQGILSLSVTPQGDRLLVHCASGPHLLFSARAPQSGALATFHYPPSAHPANNRHKWFIRTAFSPDGTAFVAGAADSAAYVWQVDCPQRPPLALGGHDGCVGPVAWCPSDPCQLATGCDSGSLRLWRLSPELASPLDLDADLQGGGSGGSSQMLPDPDQGCPDVGGKGGGAAAAGTSAAGGQGAGLQPEGAPPGSQLLGGPGQSSQDPVTPHHTPCHTTHHTSECDDPVVTAHITALSGVSLQLSQHPSTQQQQLPSSCGAERVGKEVPAAPLAKEGVAGSSGCWPSGSPEDSAAEPLGEDSKHKEAAGGTNIADVAAGTTGAGWAAAPPAAPTTSLRASARAVAPTPSVTAAGPLLSSSAVPQSSPSSALGAAPGGTPPPHPPALPPAPLAVAAHPLATSPAAIAMRAAAARAAMARAAAAQANAAARLPAPPPPAACPSSSPSMAPPTRQTSSPAAPPRHLSFSSLPPLPPQRPCPNLASPSPSPRSPTSTTTHMAFEELPADFDFDADFDDKENKQPEHPLGPFPLTTQFNRAGAGAGGTPSASPRPRPSPRARQTPGRTQPSSSPSPSALPAGAVSSGGSRGPAVSDSSWVSPSPALGYPQQQPRSGGAVSGVSSRSPSPTQGRAAAHMAALGNGWVPGPAGAAGSSGVNGALLSGPAAGASTAATNSPLSPTTQTGPASVLPSPSALTLAVPPPALPPAAHPSRAARQVLGQVPGPPLAPSPGALGSTSPASLAAALLPPAPELHSPRYRPGTLATAPQLLSSLMSSPRPQALAAGGGGLASLMPCSPRYVDAPRRNSLPGPSFLSSPRPAGPPSAAGGAPLAGQLSLPSPRSSWTAHAWGSSSRGHLGAHLGGLGSPLLSGVHLSPRPAGMPRLLPPPFPSPSPLGSLAAAAPGGGVGRAADLLTGTTARVQTALGPAGERSGAAGLPTGAAAELGQAAAAQGGEEKGQAGVSRQGGGPGMPSLPTTAAACTRSTQQPATGTTPALGLATGSHTEGTTTTLPPATLDSSKSRLPCAVGGAAPAQATAPAAAAAAAAPDPSQPATPGPATPLAPASLPAPGAVPSLPDLVLPAGLSAEFGAGSSAVLLSLQSQSLFSPRYLAPAAVVGAPGQGLLPTLSHRSKCWGSKGRSRHPAPSQQQQQQGQQEGEIHGQQQGGKEEGQQRGQEQQRGQQQGHQDQDLGIQYAAAAIAAPGSLDSKLPSHSEEPAGTGHSLEAPGAPGAVSVAGGPAAAAATGSDESGHTAPNTSGAGRQWAAAAAAEGGLGLGAGSSQEAAPAAASIQSETNHTEAVTATMHAAAVVAVEQVVSKLPGSDMHTAAELGSEQQAVGLRRQQQQSSSSSQGSGQRPSRKRARPTSILQYIHTHSHAPLVAGGGAAGAGGGAGVQGDAGAWVMGGAGVGVGASSSLGPGAACASGAVAWVGLAARVGAAAGSASRVGAELDAEGASGVKAEVGAGSGSVAGVGGSAGAPRGAGASHSTTEGHALPVAGAAAATAPTPVDQAPPLSLFDHLIAQPPQPPQPPQQPEPLQAPNPADDRQVARPLSRFFPSLPRAPPKLPWLAPPQRRAELLEQLGGTAPTPSPADLLGEPKPDQALAAGGETEGRRSAGGAGGDPAFTAADWPPAASSTAGLCHAHPPCTMAAKACNVSGSRGPPLDHQHAWSLQPPDSPLSLTPPAALGTDFHAPPSPPSPPDLPGLAPPSMVLTPSAAHRLPCPPPASPSSSSGIEGVGSGGRSGGGECGSPGGSRCSTPTSSQQPPTPARAQGGLLGLSSVVQGCPGSWEGSWRAAAGVAMTRTPPSAERDRGGPAALQQQAPALSSPPPSPPGVPGQTRQGSKGVGMEASPPHPSSPAKTVLGARSAASNWPLTSLPPPSCLPPPPATASCAATQAGPLPAAAAAAAWGGGPLPLVQRSTAALGRGAGGGWPMPCASTLTPCSQALPGGRWGSRPAAAAAAPSAGGEGRRGGEADDDSAYSPTIATPVDQLANMTPFGRSPFACFTAATGSDGSFRAPGGSVRSTAARQASPFASILHTARGPGLFSPAATTLTTLTAATNSLPPGLRSCGASIPRPFAWAAGAGSLAGAGAGGVACPSPCPCPSPSPSGTRGAAGGGGPPAAPLGRTFAWAGGPSGGAPLGVRASAGGSSRAFGWAAQGGQAVSAATGQAVVAAAATSESGVWRGGGGMAAAGGGWGLTAAGATSKPGFAKVGGEEGRGQVWGSKLCMAVLGTVGGQLGGAGGQEDCQLPDSPPHSTAPSKAVGGRGRGAAGPSLQAARGCASGQGSPAPPATASAAAVCPAAGIRQGAGSFSSTHAPSLLQQQPRPDPHPRGQQQQQPAPGGGPVAVPLDLGSLGQPGAVHPSGSTTTIRFDPQAPRLNPPAARPACQQPQPHAHMDPTCPMHMDKPFGSSTSQTTPAAPLPSLPTTAPMAGEGGRQGSPPLPSLLSQAPHACSTTLIASIAASASAAGAGVRATASGAASVAARSPLLAGQGQVGAGQPAAGRGEGQCLHWGSGQAGCEVDQPKAGVHGRVRRSRQGNSVGQQCRFEHPLMQVLEGETGAGQAAEGEEQEEEEEEGGATPEEGPAAKRARHAVEPSPSPGTSSSQQ